MISTGRFKKRESYLYSWGLIPWETSLAANPLMVITCPRPTSNTVRGLETWTSLLRVWKVMLLREYLGYLIRSYPCIESKMTETEETDSYNWSVKYLRREDFRFRISPTSNIITNNSTVDPLLPQQPCVLQWLYHLSLQPLGYGVHLPLRKEFGLLLISSSPTIRANRIVTLTKRKFGPELEQ